MLGIGVDIEKIERFKNKTLENDAHFLKSIFTDAELEYSFSIMHNIYVQDFAPKKLP